MSDFLEDLAGKRAGDLHIALSSVGIKRDIVNLSKMYLFFIVEVKKIVSLIGNNNAVDFPSGLSGMYGVPYFVQEKKEIPEFAKIAIWCTYVDYIVEAEGEVDGRESDLVLTSLYSFCTETNLTTNE